MVQIKCMIVDDEPIARDILRTYCTHLSYLNVVAAVGSALEAKTLLFEQKVDILFLDINMPVIDGVTFLKTLKNPPQVIFTTADKEYALDAFDLAACDYLLKPFSLERFITAVDKAVERLQVFPNSPDPADAKLADYIFLKTEGKIFKLHFDEILFAEANGNNTKIVTTQQTLFPTMTFSGFEELLPKSIFSRIHRSFIVNRSKINHIEGNRLFIKSSEIPIGSNFRESFFKDLGLH